MNRAFWRAGALTLALAAPSVLVAQEIPTRMWSVSLRGGAQLYAEASAIEAGPTVGVDAMYRLTRRISIGPTLDFVNAQSDGRYFVAVIPFGPDSTHVYEAGQGVSVLHIGGALAVDVLTGGRVAPYLGGGAGVYALYLGAQENGAPERMSGLALQAGGGIRFSLTQSAGVQLDARDVIYMDFDRERLNPVLPRHRNRQPNGTILFPGAEHDLPDPQSTIHNIRLTLAFTYTPGQNR